MVLTAAQIVSFDDTPPPPGASPWVGEPEQARRIEIAEPDAGWPLLFAAVRDRILGALDDRALRIDHVGSTAVPGLAAKPVIDVDLTVADTDAEHAYVPALEAAGFTLRVREPWWLGHRMLVASEPAVHLHVWPLDSPEAARHRLFRDHLRADAVDRAIGIKRSSWMSVIVLGGIAAGGLIGTLIGVWISYTGFLNALAAEGAPVHTIYNQGIPDRHIYRHWEYVLNKTSLNRTGCPWHCGHYKGSVEYSPDMCPRTLDILGRTVAVAINQRMTAIHAEQIAAAIRKVAGALY